MAEIDRFAPSLAVRFVHPALADSRALNQVASASRPEQLQQTDVVVTTYGMLQRQSWLLEMDWQLAILDEAQAIKNPRTRQTRAVKKLRAKSRIALTGTPVENRLADLWSLFDFLCPGYWARRPLSKHSSNR